MLLSHPDTAKYLLFIFKNQCGILSHAAYCRMVGNVICLQNKHDYCNSFAGSKEWVLIELDRLTKARLCRWGQLVWLRLLASHLGHESMYRVH